MALKTKPSQLLALEKIFDVIIPSISKSNDDEQYWARKSSDSEVVAYAIAMIERLKVEDQAELEKVLWLLDSRFLGMTWFGPLKSVNDLSKEQIQKMLQSWANSSREELRNLFNTLRKLCGLIYFGHVAPNGENPNWKAMKYEKYLNPNPAKNLNINVLYLEKEFDFDCDVVVVGSGAGGGVVAAEMARQGKKVLILERGSYFQDTDFNQNELDMLIKLYDTQGLLTSKNGSISILAGNSVGGGTTINWAGVLRTPDFVLAQWASEFDNPQFVDNEYVRCFDFIEKRVNTNSGIKHNWQNQKLFDVAKNMGFSPENIPLNIKKSENISEEQYWRSQGYSSMGDSFGTKQSVTKTFLQDACSDDAQIIPNVFVEKIIIKNGEAVGVEGLWAGTKKITIRAKQVVVSSGALHTPALLLRSGLKHDQIGKNLYLHPVSPVVGDYDEPVEAWAGPMMTTIVKDFARLDGNYGFRIECPPVHPGLAGSILNWENGEKYKAEMLNLQHKGIFFPLVRDKFGGSVRLSPKSKLPEIHYELSEYDKKHLLKGFEEVLKLHFEAGATSVALAHNSCFKFEPKNENLKSAIERMYRLPWKTNFFGQFSAHQMGTCRMGGTADCPVKPNGETREVRNLYVADASLFPSASGSNPMLSTQALARYVSLQIK